MPQTDPAQRFSDRVRDYVRYRPVYPARVLELLRDETGLAPTSVIADVGSGTGISSHLFLEYGNTVFGVEPNLEMRQAAEQLLTDYSNFHSIDARAEATTLPNQSVDYVVAAQAFHWFDTQNARQEFARILRQDGWVVLLWNSRRSDSTPFLRSYEALLQKYGTDYQQVQHRNIDVGVLRSFFVRGNFALRSIYNEQRFDFVGLRGRLLSSSYTPTAAQAQFRPMLDELASIFTQHEVNNEVVFEYDTEAYFGRVA
jgi:SAM-dependent methyltransferase